MVTGRALPVIENQAKLPQIRLSYEDAIEFCNALSSKEGYERVYTYAGSEIIADFSANGYRLPTEPEWEYAALGGQEGVKKGRKYAGSDDANEVAWNSKNSGNMIHMVGQKLPNDLGLFDILGNASEYVWKDYYSGFEVYDPVFQYANKGICTKGSDYLNSPSSPFDSSTYASARSKGNAGVRLVRSPWKLAIQKK